MLGIKVNIIHHISDEPQPGIVECELFDARGRRWSFVEKTAIVSLEDLRANTSYPRPGVIACEIVSRSVDEKGRDVVIIDTDRPWRVESVDKITKFEVLEGSLVNL